MTKFLPKNTFLKALFMILLICNTNVNAQDYYLDFNPGDKVTTPATVSELNGAAKFTIEATINMDSWNGAQNIFKKFNSLTDRVNLQVNAGSLLGIVSNGVNGYKKTTTAVLGLHKWYRLAMVYDGTQATAANRIKLYVNGVLQTTAYFGTVQATAPSNVSPVELAADTFDGKIDEVRLWKDALSATTINNWKDVAIDATHPNYANLKLYWNFNDNTATTSVSGSEGTSYSGDITGAIYSDEIVVDPSTIPVIVTNHYVGGYLPYYSISKVTSDIFGRLTHLFYFSLGPNANGDLGRVDSSGNFTPISDIAAIDSDISTLKTWRGQRKTKIFFTLGGWVQSDYLDEAAANTTARNNLAQNIKDFCLAKGIDGVDIDWEAYNGAVSDVNYGLLLNAIKTAFAGTNLQLSVTIDPTHTSLADEFAQADFVQLMSYGQRIAGGTQVSMSMLQGYVNGWVNAGLPQNKIVAGLPAFARQTTGSSSLTYQYIVDTYDPDVSVDTVVDGGGTYYFNGVNTIKTKSQYVVDSNLLGVVIWDLGQDKGVNHPKSILKAASEVLLVNNKPTVSITSPNNNASYNAPATVTITADAADTDGIVSKVEFFEGTNKLGEATSAPYSFDWTNVPAGSYALIAKVTDDRDAVTTSENVNITVNNVLPTVSITSPSDNANYTALANITITANASDANGSVTKVEFFNGSTKLGEDSTAPYSFNWNNVATGSYTITAKATDNDGAATISEIVNVNVVCPSVQVSIPDVYVMNPSIDDKNTIYLGYGPTTLTLNALAQGNQDVTYTWSTGVTGSSISVSQAGTYTVTATYAGGCQSTASIVINVQDVRCGNDNSKVMICHNNNNMICVAQSAVQSHLKHGDKIGSCSTLSKMASEEEVSTSPSFTVYPNPVQDSFNTSVSSKLDPNATIGIYNLLGNKIRSVRFTTVAQNVFVGDLPSGNYIVVVQNGVETFRSTIVKQ